MDKTKTVKASSIRRALTTLSKAGFIKDPKPYDDGTMVIIVVELPSELTMPKKRIRQSQTKKTRQ